MHVSTTGLVYGREPLIQSVLESPDAAVLLIADSGVGKSTVLEATQSIDGIAIAPEPARVGFGPAAIQNALFRAANEALTIYADRDSDGDDAEQGYLLAWGRVRDAVKAQLPGHAATFIVDLIGAKYGKAAGALASTVKDAWGGLSESTVRARLEDLGSVEAIDGIFHVLREMARISSASIVLALDDLQNATDDDLRRLADSIGSLPEGVRLRCAYTLSSYELDEALLRFTSVGAKVIRVPALDFKTVRELLQRNGLSTDLTPSVVQATEGYALHVVAAIELLQSGLASLDLAALDRTSVMRDSTRRAYQRLDSVTVRQAQLLSIFFDPLEDARVQTYLGLDALAWNRARQQLLEVGLFIERASGVWFHSLRRQSIWSELNDEARRMVATKAMTAILENEHVLFSDLVVLGTIFPYCRDELLQDSETRPVAAASLGEIAVAGALMEFREPDARNGFVIVDGLAMHVMEHFGFDGDAVAALQDLVEKKLVFYMEKQDAAVATPLWTRNQALLLAGRASHELGRLPVAALSSVIMDTLRPRLEPFRHLSHSISDESFVSLSESARQLQTRQRDGSFHFGAHKGPNLIVKAQYGDLIWSSAVAYDRAESRDAAITHLRGYEQAFFGSVLKVREVYAHPFPPVASRRFVRAAQRALGRSLDTGYSAGRLSKNADPPTLSWQEEMDLRAATIDFVRRRSDEDERRAYDLVEPQSLYWEVHQDGSLPEVESFDPMRNSWSIYRVTEGDSGAHRVDDSESPSSWNDPFAFLHGTKRLGLRLPQHLRHHTLHGGRRASDPFADELERLTTSAVAYNKQQDQPVLPAGESELLRRLNEAEERAAEDAALLFEEVLRGAGVPAKPDRPARSTLLVAYPLKDALVDFGVSYAEVRGAPSGRPVQLLLLDEKPERVIESHTSEVWPRPAWISLFAGFDNAELLSWGDGGLSVIANRLGY